MKKLVLFAVVLTSTIASAAGPNPPNVVAASNEVGLKWIQESAKQDRADKNVKNIMLSPLSAHLALSMAANGAGGETQKTLLQSLEMSLANSAPASLSSLNEQQQKLQGDLAIVGGTAKDDTSPTITISNGAWQTTEVNPTSGARLFEYHPQFKANLAKYYQAEIGELNFRDESASASINKWVYEKTGKMIPKVVSPDEVKKILWLLINTTYIKASWQQEFRILSKSEASTPAFTSLSGEKKSVDMIFARGYFRHVRTEFAEAVEVALVNKKGSSQKLVMYFMLPANNVVESLWNPNVWSDTVAALEAIKAMEHGTVTLPTLEFNYGIDLKPGAPLVTSLGLDYLFANNANFSAMATEKSVPSKVELIKEVTKLKLDEKGVTAAAATVVGGVGATAVEMDNFAFVANRPFGFAIVEKTSGAILFLGSVVDPTLN